MTTPIAQDAIDVALEDAGAFDTFVKKDKKSSELSWSNLRYTIAAKEAGAPEKVVITGCSGLVSPGQLTCIIGPSGAGKSSLLNVLAGRVSSGGAHTVQGDVRVNGKLINPLTFRKNIAYVMQEDAMQATSTVRESLEFSCALRLGANVGEQVKASLVNDMLRSLQLEKCQHSPIGNMLIRGVSGGERKRTAIGVELITNPDLLFLDEPTSGLDSYSAYNVVQTLRKLARAGCSVLCTIHQPSSEIFHLFDSVILIESGQIMYNGSTADVAKLYDCPVHTNPADHAMFLMQTDLEKMRATSATSASHALALTKAAASADALAPARAAGGDAIVPTTASFWLQTKTLARREWANTTRDKGSLIARFGINAFLTLFASSVFYQAGDSSRATYQLNSHFGAITNICISAMFGSAQPMILLFPYERPIFLREYATGTYGALPYFFSKVMVELPLTFLVCCETFAIAYPLIGLHGNWILLVLCAWVLSLVASSTALLVGCILTQVKQAMEAAPAIFVPQIIFSGFFIRIEQIPVWLRWAQYTCFLKFALNLVMIVEFTQCSTTAKNPVTQRTWQQECDLLLKQSEIKKDMWWVYLLVLLAMLLTYRTLAMLGLKAKAKNFYGE